jgi:hypothetical protein
MRDRRKLVVAGGLGLALLCLQQPTAEFEFLTHDSRDSAPHRVSAVVDLGLMAVSVLITWTGRRIAD